MNKKTNKIGLRAIAQRAGVSLATVSFALQNQPGVSEAKRRQILRVAKELGYTPDARIGNWMARVRDASSKDLLPIVWVNTSPEKDAWHRYRFLSPYLEGARERALNLGYRLEEIWLNDKDMTMNRLSKILFRRGIEGVLVTFPGRHLRLDWDHLAGVALGSSLLAPKLDQITADLNFNLHLALKSLKRLGFRRIGVCLAQEIDSASHYSIRATARDFYFNATGKERIPPLFHPPRSKDKRKMAANVVAWLKRYSPEVIVGHDWHLKQWVEAAGYRVPEDIGLINLAVDDDVLDWAGIHSRRRETGAAAVEWLVSLMRSRKFGVPKYPVNILFRGTWQSGQTLKTLPVTRRSV